eukprot:12766274-Alexandrium_andersonii.AAC.1
MAVASHLFPDGDGSRRPFEKDEVGDVERAVPHQTIVRARCSSPRQLAAKRQPRGAEQTVREEACPISRTLAVAVSRPALRRSRIRFL